MKRAIKWGNIQPQQRPNRVQRVLVNNVTVKGEEDRQVPATVGILQNPPQTRMPLRPNEWSI